MITVFKTAIKIGNKETSAYTANELDKNGNFVNYLSGTQVAELIGLNHSTTVQKRIGKQLKAILGEGFTTVQGKLKMGSGETTKLDLWLTVDAVKYWMYHSF